MQKIGIGYDIHRLIKGRDLILGGIKVPYKMGLEGHSDADVLTHALCDALLGAISKGDIGEHFPDTQAQYKNADSKMFLAKTDSMIRNKGYNIENIDCIIFSQSIKISPFKQQIKEMVSKVLGIDKEKVNIKAKTNEKLDSIGEDKAIAASVIALLEKPRS